MSNPDKVKDLIDETGRTLGTVDRFRVVDLFPYEISDLGRFIHRDHPVFDEDDIVAKLHWQEETKRIVEGHWVEDDGQYVFMMPKLYFYANHLKILVSDQGDEEVDRIIDYPRVEDLEWIFQSFILTSQGFSGFAHDERFTSNRIIRALHLGERDTVSSKAVTRALKYGKTPKGDLKEYIDPWEYITRFYLVDEPTKEPLGRVLYQNQASNGCAITARSTHKTYNMAVDALHENITNGAKTLEKYKAEKGKVFIFAGAADSGYLENYLDIMHDMYSSMYPEEDLDAGLAPHPVFREIRGSWGPDRDSLIQRYQLPGEYRWRGSHSTINKGIFVGAKTFAAVVKRQNIYGIDEIGRIPNFREVHGAGKNTMIADGWKFGRGMYTGTGGDIEMIAESEDVFKNPGNYQAIGIPNYWGNVRQRQGLFISFARTLKEYKKPNGKTDMLEATKEVVRQREAYDTSTDSGQDALIKVILNEPLDPREPFAASGVNLYPQQRIADRISAIEEFLWGQPDFGMPVELKLIHSTMEVSITERPDWWSRVINDFRKPKGGEEGVAIMYEKPKFYDTVPDRVRPYGSLYKVLYDPVSDKADGPSYFCVGVYKGVTDEIVAGDLYDTYVAMVVGRRRNPDDEHMFALLMSIIYHAPVFYESNVSGIPAFFDKFGQRHRLLNAPLRTIKDISPWSKAKLEPGVTMTGPLKANTTRYSNAWTREVVDKHESGAEVWRVDRVRDLRILYEKLRYDGESNFDAISMERLLMLWLKAEENHYKERSKRPEAKESMKGLVDAANSIMSGGYYN